MKCFVLAGGSGDALWPLSRKNYPKQFIHIREGRSLFQEAIARNLPFCDDFYIITNRKYRYIVEGQMQAFQGLSYQLFLEEMGRQTAPAVAIAAMCTEPEEEILVVSTDHMIGKGDYNGTVLMAKEQLTDDNIVVIGCDRSKYMDRQSLEGHSGFLYDENIVTGFISQCGDGKERKSFLLDSGIFLMRSNTFLEAIRENAPSLYNRCKYGSGRIRLEGNAFVITKEWMSTIPSLSVGQCVFEKWAGKHVNIVKADFVWSRLLNMEVLTQFANPTLQGPSITSDCSDVSILNEEPGKLMVVKDCEDLVIVNTKDATYISRKGESASIKGIIEHNYENYRDIFDEGDVFYTPWGVKEILTRSEGYLVRKVTIFPEKSLTMHKHELRSEHWSIVSGTATITIAGQTAEYGRNDSVFVPVDTFHKISNESAKDVVLIEVGVGSSAGEKTGDTVQALEDFVKLAPNYKDYLWGGHRLYEKFGKDNLDNEDKMIAESWEVSAHPAGPSSILEGNNRGMLFTDYLNKIGKEALGWKAQPFERFPLLIKFIDASRALSVQVHPDDAYAMSVEGDYGKNEMWYVMDAVPGSCLYVGFSKDITKEECEQRIKEGTLTEVLQKVPVKKGDVVFVKAGTVHAILEGLLILEIQQSSNATYRLYDYDRVDRNGQKRELHLEKALDNLNYQAVSVDTLPEGKKEHGKGLTKQLLGECKYFSAILYEIEEEAELSLDETSFSTIVFLEGSGNIKTETQRSRYVPGDSFFVPAGKKVLKITGKCKFVLSRV